MLNWNGWQDTLECLETVFRSDYDNFSVVLVDNASSDASIQMIEKWVEGDEHSPENSAYEDLFNKKRPTIQFNGVVKLSNDDLSKLEQHFTVQSSEQRSLLIIANSKNDGFALGSNLGLAIAEQRYGSEYFFLLNNDTVIEPDTISQIIRYSGNHLELGVLTSAIYYYDDRDRVANLGGKITVWGNRKYFTSPDEAAKSDISFATGCALLVKNETLSSVGKLSETFFFGEEDFEYCLRLRKANIKLGCAYESRVYHKISSSSDKLFGAGLKKIFIHQLNRLVNMRFYYNPLYWRVWKIGFSSYSMLWLMLKYKVSAARAFRFAALLNHHSVIQKDVRKETIDKIFAQITL